MTNTKYIIKTESGPFTYYYRGNMEYPWTTEVDLAWKFDFMTTANMEAVIKMGMTPSEYKVIAV